MTGMIDGIVMLQARRSLPAPSMIADSWSCGSTPAIAARKMIDPHLLPHAGRDQHRHEPVDVGQKVDRFAAHAGDDRVDHPGGRGQDRPDDAAQHHPRQEMGQVADRLHGALEVALMHFVEEQRQDDRRREPPEQPVQTDEERVAKHPAKVGSAVEQPYEVVEADPLAAPYAVEEPVFLERDDDPVHGPVPEDDGPDQGGGQQGEQIAVAVVPLQDRRAVERHGAGVPNGGVRVGLRERHPGRTLPLRAGSVNGPGTPDAAAPRSGMAGRSGTAERRRRAQRVKSRVRSSASSRKPRTR